MTRYWVVFGSRMGVDPEIVHDWINSLDPAVDVVISGGCLGVKHRKPTDPPTAVDWFAIEAALARGIPVEIYPAHFHVYGDPAGPIRNSHQARYGNMGRGFRNDVCKWSGTDDQASKLAYLDKPVRVTWHKTRRSR